MVRPVGGGAIMLGVWLVLAASCADGQEVASDGAATTDERAATSTVADDTGPATVSSGADATVANATTESSSSTISTGSDSSEASTPLTTSSSAGSLSTTDPGPDKTSTSVSGKEPGVGSGEIDPGLQPFIDDAVGQLAGRLSISASAVTVQSARLVQWSDSSVGCPEPGMQYLQVLTDGSVIELIADGTIYWFHSGGSKGPFLCDSPLRTTI